MVHSCILKCQPSAQALDVPFLPLQQGKRKSFNNNAQPAIHFAVDFYEEAMESNVKCAPFAFCFESNMLLYSMEGKVHML